MRTTCLLFAVIFAWLYFGTSIAKAADCVSIPMETEAGQYNGCEIVHGGDVQFRDAESISQAACPKVCESLNEIDALAEESLQLDEAAGFGSLSEHR